MFLISYDVNKNRVKKFSKILEQYGHRIQNSVFIIETKESFFDVKEILEKIIVEKDNFVMLEVREIPIKEIAKKEVFILI